MATQVEVDYRNSVALLKGLFSYDRLTTRLSLVSDGGIETDTSNLYRVFTCRTRSSSQLLGNDGCLRLVLGLITIQIAEGGNIKELVAAGEVFLTFHLGDRTGKLLSAAVLADFNDRDHLDRRALGRLLRQMLQQF
jgi:hypothetical protein